MNFKLDKHYLNKLIETREENILINNIYNDFLENYSRTITKEDLSYFSSYYELFLDKLEIDPFDKDFQHLAKKYSLDVFKKLDKNEYLNNPYYKKIKLDKEYQERTKTWKDYTRQEQAELIMKYVDDIEITLVGNEVVVN